MTQFFIFTLMLSTLTLLFIVPPLWRQRTQQKATSSDRKAANLAIFRDQLQELEREQAEGSLAATVLHGIELTERSLVQALERHGVKEIVALGAKFDPNLHQAMVEIPHPTALPGTVAEVMQQGFVIGERVLRPALVGVARAMPKPVVSDAGPVAGSGIDKVV